MRISSHKWLSLLLSLILITTSSILRAQASTLIFCSEGSPEGFNPEFTRSGTTLEASTGTIYSKLVRFKPGSTKVIPDLATSWEISSDGLSYTFSLRKKVKFQGNRYFKPSRDFNADDVLFTFNRQRLETHPYHNISGNDYTYFNDLRMNTLLADIRKIDDYTVQFKLTEPNSSFLPNLAMGWASIFSAEYADKMLAKNTPKLVDQQPIGTGPFQLVAYIPDATIRYRAFKDYYLGENGIKNLVFAITPDASVRFAKLKVGECHIMAYPNPADIAAMKENIFINVLEAPGTNVGYLSFNVNKKPFDQLKVRQALSMAIDKQAIIDSVFQGRAKIANTLVPPSIWSHNDDITPAPYNLEKAKELLAQAGYPNGFSTNIWAMPVQRPYMPNAKMAAELIQADWAKIGVQAKIVVYDWGEYLKLLFRHQHETALIGWITDNGDPDNFLFALGACKSGANISGWCYQPYDQLVTSAQNIHSTKQRTSNYRQAQQIMNEQMPLVPLVYGTHYEPILRRVKNYVISHVGNRNFYGVELAD